MTTLLIIDGHALIHRAYHALPDFLSKDKIPTNALYGFASVLHRVITETNATHVVVCFDTAAATFRDELFKEYRTQRPETDKELISQFPLVKDFLDAAGIQRLEKDGFEADDVIAAVTKKAEEKALRSVILTGDKDIFQLINDKVFILTPQLGYVKNGKLYDRDAVIEKFGVPPEQVADYKALVGDPSDNYKGVTGIGPKAAVELIKQFGSVESIYKNLDKISNEKVRQKLISGKADAEMAKTLAVLETNVGLDFDIDAMAFNHYNETLKEFFDKYSFKSLKARFFKEEIPKPVAIKKEKKNKEQLGLF